MDIAVLQQVHGLVRSAGEATAAVAQTKLPWLSGRHTVTPAMETARTAAVDQARAGAELLRSHQDWKSTADRLESVVQTILGEDARALRSSAESSLETLQGVEQQVSRAIDADVTTKLDVLHKAEEILQRPAETWTSSDRDLLSIASSSTVWTMRPMTGIAGTNFNTALRESIGSAEYLRSVAIGNVRAGLVVGEGGQQAVAAVSDRARELVRNLATRTPEERAELYALVNDVPERYRSRGGSFIPGISSAKDLLVTPNVHRPGELERYERMWSRSFDPTYTRHSAIREAQQLFEHDVSTWDMDQMELAVTLLYDLPKTLRVPMPESAFRQATADEIGKLSKLRNDPEQFAVELERFDASMRPSLMRQVAAARMVNDLGGTRLAHAERLRQITAKDVPDWTESERRELQAMVSDLPPPIQPVTSTSSQRIALDLKDVEEFHSNMPPIARSWHHLADPELNSYRANSLIQEILDRGEFTQRDLYDLKVLAFDLPDGLKATGPGAGATTDLQRAVTNLLSGSTSDAVKDESRLVLGRAAHAWRYSLSPDANRVQLEARLETLLDDSTELETSTLGEIAALLYNLPDDRRIVLSPDDTSAMSNFGSNLHRSDKGVDAVEYLRLQRSVRTDPEALAAFERTVERYLDGDGELPPGAESAIRRGLLQDRILDVVKAETGTQRALRAARAMSLDTRLATQRTMLNIIASALPEASESANPELTQRIEQLVDRNLTRLSGKRERGVVAGYSNYTDYAETGEVRTHLELLKAMEPAPEPTPQPGTSPSW